MTRASDRLIVCGWLTRNQRNGPPEDCWYRAIETAVRPLSTETECVPFPLLWAVRADRFPRVLQLSCPQANARASAGPRR